MKSSYKFSKNVIVINIAIDELGITDKNTDKPVLYYKFVWKQYRAN